MSKIYERKYEKSDCFAITRNDKPLFCPVIARSGSNEAIIGETKQI